MIDLTEPTYPPTAYDDLLESNVWDKRFDLPSVPIHLNPHIYTAYAVRILESLDRDQFVSSQSGATMIRYHYALRFLQDCEASPGLITTFPGTGVSSQDDAHGAAFLNAGFAARCDLRLAQHDGSYTLGPDSETKNVYRFLFFPPSLKAFAKFRVGAISQFLFIAALLGNYWFTKPGSTDGHLLLWLAFPEMRKQPVVSAFIDWWSSKQVSRGLTPQKIFQEYYLTECPWYGQWARGDWK